MDNIQSDLAQILSSQSTEFKVLTRTDAKKWESEIRRFFCDSHRASFPIWEALIGEQSFYGETADMEAEKILSSIERPIIVLIDDWYGYSGFILQNGISFALALNEIYHFQWYVSDTLLTLLVCRNDHDFVLLSERHALYANL